MKLDELNQRVQTAENNGTLKLNITCDGEPNEGIWACFVTPKDKEIYDKNQGSFEVYLMNHALISGPSWGAKLRIESNGNNRPEINVNDLIKQIVDAVESGNYPTIETFKKAKKE